MRAASGLRGADCNARAIRLEFLTRLYFSNLYKPEDVPAIYATQAAAIRRNIERLRELRSRLSHGEAYNRLSLDLRIRQLKVIEKWMAEIRIEFHISAEGAR